MITVALLDDLAKLFEPNYHYTVVLFPGTENYSTLKIAADTLIRELQELSSIGMVIDNICEIAKNQHGDRQTEWIISKKMSILNENPKAYLDHHSPPLFNMIPLDHYVPDKLHIMLRITDQMETLKIRFEFWKICDTDNWCYTFLMGNDKLCVLRKFNLAKLFDPEYVALIRSLWNGFAELYDLLEEREINPHYFRLKAKEWYELFLKKTVVNLETNIILVQGLYQSSDLTPYIHVLVLHIWEFMLKHQRWELNSFSCSAVEKKNHNHVSYFFHKTLKNGGKFQNKTSAIREIMEHENWLFFIFKIIFLFHILNLNIFIFYRF
ncbi:hypothetical protein RhiirC2_798546 [Rhizophagus irregularis]|uniref:Uncharacterized protein n=1 Tax=Rhizophagus irregularis TaxID=588596 RepID=A0A2N1M6B8_9GLOM|nr:hypothetical protein RhiirC2_798546 [Rhizophagus irregularis]